ncbi:MAG: hypothetical protein Q7J27_13470 [Syntrophales bacterium]|nr:hypothetical protein [Syntrophales bacterium]
MTDKKQKTITFEYKISPNYVIYNTSGCYGGLNAFGEIIMNVYSERNAIPQSETYKIDNTGQLSKKPISEIKKESVIRDVMFSLSINPRVARSMGQWLIEKADIYEETIEKQKQ